MGELMSSSKEITYDEGLTDYADKYKKTIQRDVLQEIRQEITNLLKTYPFTDHMDAYVKEDEVLEIIDKYKVGSEDVE